MGGGGGLFSSRLQADFHDVEWGDKAARHTSRNGPGARLNHGTDRNVLVRCARKGTFSAQPLKGEGSWKLFAQTGVPSAGLATATSFSEGRCDAEQCWPSPELRGVSGKGEVTKGEETDQKNARRATSVTSTSCCHGE